MKFLSVLVLSAFAISASAANLLDALEQHQSSLAPEPGATQDRPQAGISAPTTRPSDVDTRCDEDTQTSLPLKYLTGLLLQKDAKLDINHNASSGNLEISSAAKMIGNCNSMIDWTLRVNEIDGQKTYAVEVKFKEGESCPSEIADAGDKKCYRVAMMKDGSFDKFDVKPFSNDIRGFQKCLEASGVVGADGKINSAAIFKQPVQQKFSGLEETGKLVFLSHGPVSSQVDPRFGLERVNRCDVYEKIHPNIGMVYSTADLQAQRMAQDADALRNCKPEEYQRLVDFIERNGNIQDLNAIRDNLIQQAAQALAKKIAENKELNEEDLKVIADFERYIIEPLRIEIGNKFNEIEGLPDSEKPAARAKLTELKNKLLSFSKAPFFQRAHVEKLMAKGLFDEAEKMEGIRITIGEASKIGRNGNQVVTPDQARIAISNAREQLKTNLAVEREKHEIRTGVITDRSATYRGLAQTMRDNIRKRTENYTREIQLEYARIQQPNGYCFKYFRNTQKCIQDSVQRIQELQTSLAHYNKIDNERATQYDQQAAEYAKMEAEGRRVSGQESPEDSQPTDTTAVPPRSEDQAQAAAAAQMVPQGMMMPQQPYMNPMMMQQQNPYANMYGQQGGWMGQAGFNAGFGYQGTMGQNFMGMPQQYGSVGVNWFGMGQQLGGQMGMNQGLYGMQSPYGQMYGQNPYMQQPMMGQMGMGQMGMGQMGMGMPQAYSYPSFF